MTGYRSRGDDAEVWIVRPDGLRRAFRFPPGSKVWIGNGIIKFYNSEMREELTIDEDEKSGRPPRGKLDLTD